MAAKRKKSGNKLISGRIILVTALVLAVLIAGGSMLLQSRQTLTTKASEENKCYKDAKACFYKCSLLSGEDQNAVKVNCQKTCMSAYSACRQEQTFGNRLSKAGRPELSCQQKCSLKKAACKSQCEICAGPEGRHCSLCPIKNEDKCNKVCKSDYDTCISPCDQELNTSSSSSE